MAETTSDRIFTVADFIKDGAERTVVRTYADEDLVTLVEWIDPGKEFEPPHWHPEAAHVFVFMSGEGEALLGNGVWQPVRAGQFLVNPRNKVHAMRNTSATERLVWTCIHVTHGLPYVVNEVDESHS
jgi:mannose-6-phosphate isomerase-like protein (cupin superfamily)